MTTTPDLILPHIGERLICSRVPEGFDGFVLSRYLKEFPDKSFVYVVQNEARMIEVQDFLEFLEPLHQVLTFPAWDCLPYDRVAPRSEIMSQRMKVLSELQTTAKPICLITTVSAVLQRVPPSPALCKRQFLTRVGDEVDIEVLKDFLVNNGYSRVATVRAPGEYAIRGGIIDLYPAGETMPIRLDLFGSELESLRTFDPATQRSQQKRSSFSLDTVGEITLSQQRKEQFCAQYLQHFGVRATKDALYQDINSGQVHQGMEHWLPLFYEHVDTLFDNLACEKTVMLMDHQIEHALARHIEQIDDYYQARQEALSAGFSKTESAYRALPPSELYLDLQELQDCLSRYPLIEFSPFLHQQQQQQQKSLDFAAERFVLREEGPLEPRHFEELQTSLLQWNKDKVPVLLASYSRPSGKHLLEVLENHGVSPFKEVKNWPALTTISGQKAGCTQIKIEQGFISPDLVVISEQDLLGQRQIRPLQSKSKTQSGLFVRDISALSVHDLVVHEEHGVGKYLGLDPIEADGIPHDCLSVEYAGGNKLFVPVENIEALSLYGSEGSQARLDHLGAASWQKRRAKIKKRLEIIADQLLKIASEREMRRGEKFQVSEGIYQEFSAQFPYLETDDQIRAIAATIEDLCSGKPMDRLICGDVGFGKTEVALRAAFVVASAGHQVAVLVPTTLLARQHFKNFSERFQGFGLKVGQLSRMVSPTKSAKVKAELAAGKTNIVIGTHALLSSSTEFKKLGMVVIDEEQHFGVKQKEKLKALKSEIHVLTLTATPIPRTLQMALTGVRDMSLIATPPVDRLAVRTFVMPFDGVVIKEAILRETDRGGQVFYVCPRLEDLSKVFKKLNKLLPDIRMATAHGQMPAEQLEEVMLGFYSGKYQLLLSTNIVESGLDIPTANTIIIHRSDRFGLSQLYQLRGRVGRSKQRGYAYFLLPPHQLGDKAQKRLEVMQTLDSLGAGFQLASHDMDIRGAGNLLGSEQSGHIREVGVELYQQMLEEAVATVRAQSNKTEKIETKEESWSPQINLGLPVLIPDYYVEDLGERLGLYRRISLLTTPEDLADFMDELKDRFGTPTDEVENLKHVIELKQLCRSAGVSKLDCGAKGAVASFHKNAFNNPAGLIAYVNEHPDRLKLKPDQRLVFMMHWFDDAHRIKGVKAFLSDLAEIACPTTPTA